MHLYLNISKIALYQFSLPLFDGSRRKGILLELTDQWGETSWGEISPLENWSNESFEDALKQTQQISNLLLSGKWSEYESLRLFPSVSFGIEMALMGFFTFSSPIDYTKAHLIMGEKMNSLQSITGTCKLKVGELCPEHAATLIKKMPKCNLRIDCNRKWTLEQALTFTSFFSLDDFEFIEEPVRSIKDLKTFSDKTHFPIALDETLREVENFPEIPSLKAIVLKPTLSGGISAITSIIKKYPQLKVVFSSAFESALGIAQIIRMAHFFEATDSLGIDTLSYFSENLLHIPEDILPTKFVPDREKLCPLSLVP